MKANVVWISPHKNLRLVQHKYTNYRNYFLERRSIDAMNAKQWIKISSVDMVGDGVIWESDTDTRR